jgi:ApaG protein
MLKIFPMFSTTTFDIKVSVLPEYDVKNSFPSENRFVFRYNITIENLGKDPIQLLRRRWIIYDLGFGFTEVSGDGVIGLTPEIKPGDNFTYFSNVMLRSGVGNMQGVYFCKNSVTDEDLAVDVPKFNLLSEVLSN